MGGNDPDPGSSPFHLGISIDVEVTSHAGHGMDALTRSHRDPHVVFLLHVALPRGDGNVPLRGRGFDRPHRRSDLPADSLSIRGLAVEGD
jgi:hypothetical protein